MTEFSAAETSACAEILPLHGAFLNYPRWKGPFSATISFHAKCYSQQKISSFLTHGI